MEHELHNVKIIGNGKQHHILIDDKDMEGVLEANLSIKPCEHAQLLVMKSDVKVNSIELKAEVEEIQNKLMNFGKALEELKQGKKVARKG